MGFIQQVWPHKIHGTCQGWPGVPESLKGQGHWASLRQGHRVGMTGVWGAGAALLMGAVCSQGSSDPRSSEALSWSGQSQETRSLRPWE